jgi:hypothetical protein
MVVRPLYDEVPGDHEYQVPPVLPPPLQFHTAVTLLIALPSTFWILELVGTRGSEIRFQPGCIVTVAVVTVDVPWLMVNGLGLDAVTLKPLKGLRAVTLILQLGAVVEPVGSTLGHDHEPVCT